MRAALALARRGLGRVSPNPAVGCILVKEGRIVGRGWTCDGGRPHAESEALARAGAAARGATAYVSLEPCSHHGQTPPCSEALIAAGIARCVIACRDPDRRVDGRGIEALEAAGIAVEVGLYGEEAEELNRGFFLVHRHGRPLVTLKLASTLDGKIATRSGESRWITGEAARLRAHLLRAGHDAVMVGSGTAVLDDPRLNVRIPGYRGRQPLRLLLDGRLRIPLTHDLVARAGEQPTWIFTRNGNPPERLEALAAAGVELVTVDIDADGNLSSAAILKILAQRGVTRVLVEGGSHLAAALLRDRLVDRLAWFHAPQVIGADGLPAVVAFGSERLELAPRFQRTAVEALGEDLLESYRARD